MLIYKCLKYSLQLGSVMPKDLSIFLKMALSFVGLLWSHMDGINDGNGL